MRQERGRCISSCVTEPQYGCLTFISKIHHWRFVSIFKWLNLIEGRRKAKSLESFHSLFLHFFIHLCILIIRTNVMISTKVMFSTKVMILTTCQVRRIMGSLHLFVLDREKRKSAECDLSDYYVETMGIHDGWGLQVSYLIIQALISMISFVF